MITPGELREEDKQLIEEFINYRQSLTPVVYNYRSLYYDPTKPATAFTPWQGPWSKITADTARKYIAYFAKRIPVPLLYVGMGGYNLRGDLDEQTLRAEVVLFFNDYAERVAPRIAARNARFREGDERYRANAITTTQRWFYTVTYCKKLYEYLELSGQRPMGTNPFMGLKRRWPVSNKRIINVDHYTKALGTFTKLRPRDQAIMALAAHGFRNVEIRKAKMSGLDLDRHCITIIGKNSQMRSVFLLPWAMQSVGEYLTWRNVWTDPMSPWLFPVTHKPSKHIGPDMIKAAVRKCRALCEDQNLKISVHGFRHFFVTECLRLGIPREVIKAQTGHRSDAVFSSYITVNEKVQSDVFLKYAKDWRPIDGLDSNGGMEHFNEKSLPTSVRMVGRDREPGSGSPAPRGPRRRKPSG